MAWVARNRSESVKTLFGDIDIQGQVCHLKNSYLYMTAEYRRLRWCRLIYPLIVKRHIHLNDRYDEFERTDATYLHRDYNESGRYTYRAITFISRQVRTTKCIVSRFSSCNIKVLFRASFSALKLYMEKDFIRIKVYLTCVNLSYVSIIPARVAVLSPLAWFRIF